MPPAAGNYPIEGPIPPTAGNYPKQEANAISSGKLPHQGANAANGGKLPQARGQCRKQREATPGLANTNQIMAKTVTSTPYRKRLPQRQETGQIHSTAFSYGNLRKQKLPLRQFLHYPQTGNRMYHILDRTPGYEPPRRGTRGAVCYSRVATSSTNAVSG